jgi:hypothetical protein
MQMQDDERYCSDCYLGSKRRFAAAPPTTVFQRNGASRRMLTIHFCQCRAASCALDFRKPQYYVNTVHSRRVETLMRSFILACVAAVAIATLGAFALNSFQQSAAVAFTTESVRV